MWAQKSLSLSLSHRALRSHTPAGCDGAVEPERILSLLRPVLQWDLRDIKHRQAVVYVAFHTHLTLWLVCVHVHEPRDHVRREGHNERLDIKDRNSARRIKKTKLGTEWADKKHTDALTFVTTESTAIPLRISCQAPMLWAFAATGRLNWVVSFQESTLTSMMLLISANRGARGKEATNSVMKPNWITGTQRRQSCMKYPKAILE